MKEDGGDPSLAMPSSDSPTQPKRILDSPSESPKPQKLPRSVEEGCGEGREGMSQNPRLQRYLVAVEYIGTRFSGSQRQPNCRTVVGVLEDAFHKFIGQPVSISFSSRTDAGVHALSNVCHVDVERISKRKPGEVLTPHEPGVVRRAVNHFLQKCEGDITVIDVRCVPADFHARFKALERTYHYRILSGPEPLSTFEKDRAWHVPEELDILAMKAKSPIKTLDELSVTEVLPSLYFPSIMERSEMESLNGSLSCSKTSDHELPANYLDTSGMSIQKNSTDCCQGFGHRSRHRCYVITARARSFLYHQVRLMVGGLKSVGTGEITVSDVERILNAKSVTAASPMAPACGLYLGTVKYDIP
uniref:tRNA pseudouridine synthase n=1 Tax=Musa acuminata subsp. malaccensis TaxID=214687 RepID=A0A804KH75_MUSAM|nr:PREDICTED: uncharacterized protein LOC103997456 isoform X2 [Musa acuminata subsp. malaccensis]